MANVSIFKNAKEPVPSGVMDFDAYLNGIRDGVWQDEVLQFRTGKREKISLTGITPSGTFKERRAIKNLDEHTGFINIDIDKKGNTQDIINLRDVLYADPFIYAAHISVSGGGLSAYIRINPEKHSEVFIPIQRYLANKYHISIDEACKDVSRLRFVSYDPELYLNTKSRKWTETIKKEEVRELLTTYAHSGDDVDFVLEQVKNGNVDIAPSYDEWLRLGFALSSKFGEGGRQTFHMLSQYSVKYNQQQTEKQYTNCLKHGGNGVTMNYFFYLAKNAGLQIVTPQTKKIEQVARLRKKQVGKSGGYKNDIEAKANAMKYLQEVDGIDSDVSMQIIEQAWNKEDDKKQIDTKEEKLELVFAYIDGIGIRHNSVTQRAEVNGKDMTDIMINSIYINAITIFGEKLSKQIIVDYIYSDRIPSYNPFHEFFNKYSHMHPSGEVDKLIATIKGTMRDTQGRDANDYNQYFIEKWLLSLISSAYGTYSLMILVLTGKQLSGKTKWFRGLLPSEISRYYAESKLDEGKDDQINMCTHLILCDDEYGGKSKQEAKKLKDLSSKQIFTVRKPYGRNSEDLNRIAVLCGTSNDTEVINDITGNRRVIPVNVESIDFTKYDAIDKVAVFMELYHKWRETGNDWMLTSQDVAMLNEFTNEYTESSTEAELIAAHFFDCTYTNNERYSPTQIRQYLESVSGIKYLSQRRIGMELKKMGYICKLERIGNSVFRAWKISKKAEFNDIS